MRIGLIVSMVLLFNVGCQFHGNKARMVRCTSTADGIEVHSQSDDFQLKVEFRKNGVNQLMSLDRITLTGEQGVSETKACTDWVGPYMVRDVSAESVREKKPQFTGGWHGSNGDGTGQPTAQTVNDDLIVDGNPAKVVTEVSAGKVTVKVTNHIKSYNTGAYVLEERIIYILSPAKIDIHVTITALKDAEIVRYYGLQTQNGAWDREIKYVYQDGGTKVAAAQGASNSGACSKDNPVLGFELSATRNPYTLYAWIAPTTPLTSYRYVSARNPGAFTAPYGKSYFNLVNGIPLGLKQGQRVEWFGGYLYTSH